MNSRQTRAQRRRVAQAPDWSPQGVGLAPQRYEAALRYLFDRPVPQTHDQEWYWNIDEPDFEATPLEWTRIQTVLFARAGIDLAPFGDEQVGMGLNYVMSNAVSNVPFAAIDASVALDEAMRMMRAMPMLWRQCIGPRLASLRVPIGTTTGRLAYVCYMWFDVWPTFWNVRHEPRWRDAVWQVLREMLDVPCREVQVAALHGIGHCGRHLERQDIIDRIVEAFIRSIDKADQELKDYADAARRGCVQ
ncbi:hypothetical protein [Caldimonas sp. KR1-144]|uniref:hypothetical protein n=1 Tax=Caldimonas sp. KR1-144 TaxID=3400911 RepID=UPI003C0512F4